MRYRSASIVPGVNRAWSIESEEEPVPSGRAAWRTGFGGDVTVGWTASDANAAPQDGQKLLLSSTSREHAGHRIMAEQCN